MKEERENAFGRRRGRVVVHRDENERMPYQMLRVWAGVFVSFRMKGGEYVDELECWGLYPSVRFVFDHLGAVSRETGNELR